MSIIGNWTATPNRAEMLIEFIKNENKQYKKIDLEELFTPQSPTAFRENYNTLESLQLIKVENDIVKLNVEKSKLSTLQLIKNSIFNNEFVYKDNFVYALAWLMIQDSKSMQDLDWQGQVNSLIKNDLNESFSELDLTNNSSWQHFYYWCNYLGFATKSYISKSIYICPDPTEAISNELVLIFEEKNELKINEFLKLLSQKIPVFEFGSARIKVMENIREGLSLASNQLSFATSLALLRLEERGIIKLEQKSDADSMSLKNSNEDRIISHILYLGK